jgi:hypothetical protein
MLDRGERVLEAMRSLVMILGGGIALVAPVGAFDPPVGIPAPSFGIDDTHAVYVGQLYAAGGFVNRDSGSGPYTHYVDNSTPDCTDSGSEDGTEVIPRCSPPPADLPAGTVVELPGGPYLVRDGFEGGHMAAWSSATP